MMLRDRIEEILRTHVPDEERACWANERWCQGCESATNIHLYAGGGYHRHQAELIIEAVRDHLGTR